MTAISQNFPNAYKDLSLQPSLAVPRVNSAPELRSRLESALQEITRELRACPVSNFSNELQVWAINFSYYLTLDTPEQGLKTYIPLLKECLQKCAYPSHPAYILMSAWLKHPDFQAEASAVGIRKKAHVFKQGYVLENGDVGFIYPSFLAKISKKADVDPLFPITEVPSPICHEFRNFTPLPSETEMLAFRLVPAPMRQLCHLWQLRKRADDSEDLLWAKMGKTNRVGREFIFSFLSCSDLNIAAGVCRDFFARSHSVIVYNAVYLPRFRQTHPDLLKREHSAELESAAEKLKTLMDQVVKNKAVVDAAINKLDLSSALKPFCSEMSRVTDHLLETQKTFPYEMLFFHAAQGKPAAKKKQ